MLSSKTTSGSKSERSASPPLPHLSQTARSLFNVLLRNTRSPSLRGCGFHRNALAETFELTDEPPGETFLVLAADEVVATEFGVGLVLAQDVVGGDKDRMSDSDDRLAAAALDAQVLRAQVGVLGAAGGALRGLDQRGPKPEITVARLAGAALASGFIVPELEVGWSTPST